MSAERNNTVELTKELINKKSITPDDNGCQKLLISRLEKSGFKITEYNKNDVSNFWATHGKGHPVFVFAGHTDVVPAGDEKAWNSPPFTATEKDGYLFGRGAADMKSSLAAMIVATENFLKRNPNHPGTIAFLVTSDEEGANNEFGTKYVISQLNEKIDYCIVGEASSEKKLGDQIKIGRRGSVHGKLVVHGKQGHIAYPEKTKNPIHWGAKIIAAISEIEWDQGNKDFPPTSLQFYDIQSGIGATNVVPPTLTAKFNFRYSPESSVESLEKKIRDALKKFDAQIDLEFHTASPGYYSQHGKLISVCETVLKKHCDTKPQLSTSGGTSDGRFIAKLCPEIIELGPINATIHQVNECININDLETLSEIYQSILNTLLSK